MTQKQNNMDTIISSVGCLKGGWTIFGEASRMGKQTFFHFPSYLFGEVCLISIGMEGIEDSFLILHNIF